MSNDQGGVPYIRRAIQEMGPKFDPPTEGVLRHKGYDTGEVLAMGLNESLFPPSPKVLDAVRANLTMMNRYPDAQCPALSDIVTARTGVPVENIVWGNGSEELIQGAIHISISPGDGMILPVPTFWGYRAMVEASEADCAYVGMKADGHVDADAVLGAVGNRTKLLFLVTPNNPSGRMLDGTTLRRFVEEVPENVLLGVDEAYHEFGLHAGGPDVVEALKERRGPWVVIRTFSKAYAMAGMRIGYALCSDGDIAQALRKTTCTFNVPILAQAAAEAALLDEVYLAKMLNDVSESRAMLEEGLRDLGLDPFPSVCNFVSANAHRNARELAAEVLENGVQLHAWPEPGYETYIRITVAPKSDVATCLEVLAAVLNK